METLMIWPEHPVLSILVLWAGAQIFFFAAREPVHQAIKAFSKAMGNAFRVAAKWWKNSADSFSKRNREVLLESGRLDAEKKLEREFVRLNAGFAKELKGYPALHQRLDSCVSRIEADYEACTSAPPNPPEWHEATQAVAAIPDKGDRATLRVLEEIKKAAVESEKQALKEYREATSKRHKILHAMAPVWKDLRAYALGASKEVKNVLQMTTNIDGAMERYEKIRAQDSIAERMLAASQWSHFLVALITVGIAVGGAFVNFQLIALPMSELVPAGAHILGLPIAAFAALVIVLMEAAAGIFVMDALGVTELLPKIGQLHKTTRRLILGTALCGLFLLACIEASLAVLREHIVAADMVLKAALAGTDPSTAVATSATSSIPLIGQAVLGFILPWILAMTAMPLEMLVQSGRHVGGRTCVAAMSGVSALFRMMAVLFQTAADGLIAVFDIFIILPIKLCELFQKHTKKKSDSFEKPTRRYLKGSRPLTREHGVAS